MGMTHPEQTSVEFEDLQERSRNVLRTWKIAPMTLNRELSAEAFQGILDGIDGVEWEYLGRETGDCRTVSHYYEVEHEGHTWRIDHNQCGLEFHGNNITFEPLVPEGLRWEIAVGIIEFGLQRRENDEHSRWMELEPRAVEYLRQEFEALEEGDFDELRRAVDGAKEIVRAKRRLRRLES